MLNKHAAVKKRIPFFGAIFASSKKGISPVVATILLLVVSIVAVVGFQNWYSGFESGILTNTEQKTSANAGGVNIEFISSDGILYITNTGTQNISMSTIKIGDTDCNLSQNLTPGVNNFSISSCLNFNESISEVRLITDDSVISKKIFTGDFETPLIIVLSTSLSCNTDLDGDGFINFTCAVYPMTDTTLEGYLDINDFNSTIKGDSNCWLKTNKSGCESNFIVDGCGVDTVLDIGTNLCWERNMSSFLDHNGGPLSWSQANLYCNTTLVGFNGFNDWRVPTRQELFTLRDLSRFNPAIVGGNSIFEDVDIVDEGYWTSFNYNGGTNGWLINFASGWDQGYILGTASSNAVCVRDI